MVEEWRPIAGWEGLYEASNIGRVRNARTQYVLKQHPHEWGYVRVGLYRRGSRPKEMKVHRAVALAFLPQIEGKPHVNHKNGIKTDNRVENLEWMTKRENEEHAGEMGRHHAVTNPNRGWKLTVENVADIRARFAAGERGCDIHRNYQHVNLGYLYKVCRGLKRERDAQPHSLQKEGGS